MVDNINHWIMKLFTYLICIRVYLNLATTYIKYLHLIQVGGKILYTFKIDIILWRYTEFFPHYVTMLHTQRSYPLSRYTTESNRQ